MNEVVLLGDAVRSIRLQGGKSIQISDRCPFSLRSDSDTYRFDFSWHHKNIEWSSSLFEVLIGLLGTHSIEYSHRCSYYVGRFAREVLLKRTNPESPFALEDLSDWPTLYGVESWRFMQAVLGRWATSRRPGLSSDIVDFLKQPTKWETEGNGSYFALVANDPERGALTDQELRSIQQALNRAYQQGQISVKEWALTWFLIGTGVRPVQVARSKINDVHIDSGPQGKEVTLMVPLAKKHTGDKSARWKRKAPTQLAEVLVTYLESPAIRSLPQTSPLFFGQSSQIQRMISGVFERLDTHSERLDSRIPLFAYRFRYTLGTRAIALGATDHVAARLLTHSTTHCIQFYRASLPQLQEPLHDALGEEMAFFAQAFQGRLIDSLDEATRSGDSNALITDFAHLMGQDLGACGTCADCHQDAPRACLVCIKFEPFAEAPWEALLEVLVADLNSESEGRIRQITEEHICAVREIMAARDARSVA